MAREIPEAVRAVAGLAATVLDEARKLPETLPGLPIRVLGVAMQMSMKLQQHYAGLVARGDELFTGIRGENEPGLATFDEKDTTCCYALQDKVWVHDPAGAPWEIYTVKDDDPAAPRDGFDRLVVLDAVGGDGACCTPASGFAADPASASTCC